MVRLAEERGEIGGQRIGEGFPLFGVVGALQHVQVLLEGSDAGGAQASREATVNHFLLAVGQCDAGPLVDQATHSLEITAVEIELLAG